jgi:hypothetical protein
VAAVAERAAHFVDHVFPHVRGRQSVLSSPSRLRYLVAWDHNLRRSGGRGTPVRANGGAALRVAQRQIPDAERLEVFDNSTIVHAASRCRGSQPPVDWATQRAQARGMLNGWGRNLGVNRAMDVEHPAMSVLPYVTRTAREVEPILLS